MKMSLEGVGFGLGYDPTLTVQDIASAMEQAESRGFDLAFVSETIELMRDAVTTVAAIGLSTTQLAVGLTQVVRLRTPVVMAQTLASLDELTNGRLIACPGACTNTHARRHGLDPVKPSQALREWIAAIRSLINGTATALNGETVKLENVELGWKPQRSTIPIWIPATTKTGLRIAGEIGDGVLLNSVCSPEYAANAIEIVRNAVEKSGRNWEEFAVAQIISCSVDDDSHAAIDAIRWEVATKLGPYQLPYNSAKLKVGEPYLDPQDFPRFQEAWEKGGKPALTRIVPDSYVEGMTASGTPEKVAAKVLEYREAGVKLPILRPANKGQVASLLDLFGSKVQ